MFVGEKGERLCLFYKVLQHFLLKKDLGMGQVTQTRWETGI